MKTYTVICPICGHVNRNLLLEETDGWMECEKCNQVTKEISKEKMVKIPVFFMNEAEKLMGV